MKAKNKRLQLKKLTVAKISNMDTIKGGIEITYTNDKECDLTTRPRESVEGNNCESVECDDIFDFF